MPKQKTLDEVREEIVKTEHDLRQNENKVKRLLQANKTEERKLRTRRLIERGAIVESIIREPDTLTNEQIKRVLHTGLRSQPARELLEQYRRENAAASRA